MDLWKHYKRMFWDVCRICGLFFLIMTVVTTLKGREILTPINLWQIALLGATLVFRSESLINFHGLEEHTMRQNYFISSLLADGTLLILLYYFTPGGQYFVGKGWHILIIYVVFKSLFYLLIYLKYLLGAREINRLIKERKQDDRAKV
ncbi:MAG: hypothetical protein PQJ59_14555 [Spirochaetales bacterium]|nr:hypothetical protein [Spirochaetales bacterium]